MTLHLTPRRRRASGGFTLIELMITVAVIGIIAAIAYPSYQDSIRKARRTDGMLVLTEASQFMERFGALNLRYDQDAAGVAVALPANLASAPKEGSTKYYNITIQSVSQGGYTLQAEPVNAQADDVCGTLKVDSLGVRSAARTTCWMR